MPHALNVTRAGLLLLAALASPLHAADVGVLTPASRHLRIILVAGSPSAFLGLGVMSAGAANRGDDLDRWAKRDGYDVSARLTQQLLAGIDRSGHSGIAVAVTRRSPESTRPIARDELPSAPGADRLLDVTLSYVGLIAKSPTASYEPGFMVEYRWLGPDGDLMQATRFVVYNHELGAFYRNTRQHDSYAPFVKPYKTDDSEANPDCGFRTLKAVESDTTKLWSCFDEALAKISDVIARDMPASTRPPGGMTSERDGN
ncbi:MAG: hypothetical protein ACRET4_08795 [Steroidobacteraceae bacterium]